MLDRLIKKFINLNGRLSKYVLFKMKVAKLFKASDSYEAYKKALEAKYHSKCEDKIYKLKEPIREELRKAHYYIPYRIVNGLKEYKIDINYYDKKNVLKIYTNKYYLEASYLYHDFNIEELNKFLNNERISKVIINPEGCNAVMSKTALEGNIAIIINKNKLKLE